MKAQFCIVVAFLAFSSQVTIGAPSLLCVASDDLCANSSATLNCDECYALTGYLANDLIITSNSSINFLGTNYVLSKTLLLKNISNVILQGYNSKVTIWCSGNGTVGFIFQNISNLVLKNLKLVHCGAFFRDYLSRLYRASLLITKGGNLTLINVTIFEGFDAGIITLDVRNTTFISHLVVNGTKATESQLYGNEIAYLDCHNESNPDYRLILQDSYFIENHCRPKNKKFPKYITGLTVYVSHCYARINITRTQFVNNSGSHLGGNLAIIYQNLTNISAQHLNLSDVLIEGGTATGGAGLYIFITKYVNSSNLTQLSSSTVIENVIFKNNVAADVGAAMYIQLKASTHKATVHHNIVVKNCIFSKNSLTVANKGGVALYSNYFDIDGYLFQVSPQYKIVLSNCLFQDHYVNKNTPFNQSASGNSVVSLNSNTYFEIENVTITNNSVNAITAISSNLVLKGNVTLSYNTGSSGGGLLLCQNAIMYLTSNTNVFIYNNNVSHAGGGICVEEPCILTRPQCFFQVDNKIKTNSVLLNTIHVYIYNNTASYGGHNLFGGDVDYCYMTDSPDINQSPFSGMKVYTTTFSISNGTSSITSQPRHICFCSNSHVNCSQDSTNITTYPGEDFVVEAVLVGQLNGTVPGVVQSWMQPEEQYNFKGSVQNITYVCSKLNYTVYVVDKNQTFAKLSIGVRYDGDQSGYERLHEYKRKQVIVRIDECPIGFTSDTYQTSNGTCANCVLDYKELECHVEAGHRAFIRRKTSGNVWIGLDYSGATDNKPTSIKHSVNCPFDYCVVQTIELNMTQKDYKKTLICANNRSGIGCGGCKRGYSALLGSSKCGKCTNKYLALVIAFALAGFALVAALTLLNLTVAGGYLSGLIFYANVVESGTSFLVPQKKYHVFPTPLLTTFVAWINLKVGIPTCLYNGMDAYAEAWLEFVFPLYMWGIAILIILLSNRFQLVAQVASRNAVKVLATLVLLSYTTFTHAVLRTFSYVEIHTLYRDNSTKTEISWLIDANIKYFEFKHALLFAVAMLFGLITLPFTFILLFIKPLQRFSHKNPLKWLERLKPFIDAYTGPYTNSGRFWPGMLLLARICLSITGGLNTLSAKRVVQNVTSMVIITLLGAAGMVRPGLYRSRALDVLEYFFLFNLAALFVGVTYYDGSGNSQKAVFDVSVGLALFVFIVIVLYHLYLKIQKCTCVARVTQNLLNGNHYQVEQCRLPVPNLGCSEEREPLLAVVE